MLKIKIPSVLDKFKYELSAFLLLVIQALMNIDFKNGMNSNFYVYYLADFSMGKTSRLLIGSLVNLLTDSPTTEWINRFAASVLLVTFILTSLLIGRVVKSSEEKIKTPITVFSLFYVSGAFTFCGFSKFFGILDIYMYLFTVLSLICVKNRVFRWLIPVFCVGGVLTNYIFTLSFYPIIALVLLYLIVTNEKKASNVTILLLSGGVSVALMFYCLIVGKTTATMPFEEMWQTMENKLGSEISYNAATYYEFYLYGTEENSVSYGIDINASVTDFIVGFSKYLLETAHTARDFITVGFGALPVFFVFWYLWGKCIVKSETKPKKFFYLCLILSPLFTVVCCLLSTDITRWAAPGVFTQFILGFVLFVAKDMPFEETLLELKAKLKGKTFLVLMLWLVYASFFTSYSITG